MPETSVAILGAGPAGLALACQLAQPGRKGLRVIVVERDDAVGGLTRSFEWHGIHFDRGSHRLHPATAPHILEHLRLLLGDDLRERPRNGRIRLLGSYVRFPFTPFDLLTGLPLSFGVGVMRDALLKLVRSRSEPRDFAEALRAGVGPTVSECFYFPYARKLWGVEPEELSVEQARRRVGRNRISAILRAAVLQAIRFGRRTGATFYYPARGFGQISEALSDEARRRGVEIRLSEPARSLDPQSDGSIDVALGEDTLRVRYVFSTLPITTLDRLLGTAQAHPALRSRAMVLVYLLLETPRFTPFDAHYFPEAGTMLSRLSEPKNYSGASEPAERTGLCGEIPCDVGDDVWNAEDRELVDRVVSDLRSVELPVDVPILEAKVIRAPHVYPVYDHDFETRLEEAQQRISKAANVVSLGRQGLFAHDNTHHTIETAYAAADCYDLDNGFDWHRWAEYCDSFRQHVVED